MNDGRKPMGVPGLDHLNISRNGFFSFLEHGPMCIPEQS